MSRNTRFGLGFFALCLLGFVGIYAFMQEVAGGMTVLAVAYAVLWLGAIAGLNLLMQRWRTSKHSLEQER